jgi:flagellar assembly factor FliW
MPLVQTRRFGPLEYADSSVLSFVSGPPGFVDQTRFTLVERPELAPVVLLQSLDSAELCFWLRRSARCCRIMSWL